MNSGEKPDEKYIRPVCPQPGMRIWMLGTYPPEVDLWVDAVYVKAGLEKESEALLVGLEGLSDGSYKFLAIEPRKISKIYLFYCPNYASIANLFGSSGVIVPSQEVAKCIK